MQEHFSDKWVVKPGATGGERERERELLSLHHLIKTVLLE